MFFREIRLLSDARGVTLEKCYDQAKANKQEDVSRETPRVTTDTLLPQLEQIMRTSKLVKSQPEYQVATYGFSLETYSVFSYLPCSMT